MDFRTSVGAYLAISAGVMCVWATFVVMLEEVDALKGTVVAVIGGLAFLAGMWLVVTRGAFPPSVTSSAITRAAFVGGAWGVGASLAAALWVHWLLPLVVLPLAPVAGATIMAIWLLLPEPIRVFIRALSPR